MLRCLELCVNVVITSDTVVVDEKERSDNLSVEKTVTAKSSNLVIRTRHQRHIEQYGEEGIMNKVNQSLTIYVPIEVHYPIEAHPQFQD